MRADLPTTIILKTTDSCNAACRYCYEDNAAEGSPNTISLDVVEEVYRWAVASGLAKVQIVWHGGEPLIAGIPFFRQVFSLQKRYEKQGLEYLHSLQTNGVLVDDDWIELFRSFDIGVGLSLDGPAWIHDEQRPLTGGRPSHGRALSALERMTTAGLRVSLSAVVTRRSLGAAREIVSFFSALRADSVDFLPMAVLSPKLQGNSYLIRAAEFGRFISDVYMEWAKLGEDRISIRYIENMIRGVTGYHPTLCTFSGRCGAYISIDFDGSVYPCDSFMRAPELKLGNLQDQNLSALLAGRRYLTFRNDIARLSPACEICEILPICNGGCPSERYSGDGMFARRYPFCETRRHLARLIASDLDAAGADGLVRLPVFNSIRDTQ
ncbi:MAG: radical SAM protein [Deltaproteobacteria bacterium]|nr:radical SAM protein [Deltaproteobacteria bacterium]